MIAEPLVSIGFPVRNGQATLRAALHSLLSQRHRHVEVIISDNASDDGTAAICEELAALDPRIRYHRQPHDIGGEANFLYVLDQAKGEYFMWAAADDIRSEDFVDCNLQFLQAHPDYVLSTSPVRFANADFDPRWMGDGALTGDAEQRIRDFFCGWHCNGRMYSLMRSAAVRTCPRPLAAYLGYDWSIVLHLLAQGKAHRHGTGWIALGPQGMSRSKNIFRIYRRNAVAWVLPFAALSGYTFTLTRSFSGRVRMQIASSLAKLNAMAFVYQFLLRWR